MSNSTLNKQGFPVLKAEWLLTRTCQLFCDYCEIAHKPIKEIPLAEKKAIADRLKEFNVFPVIYGGETTLSKDFPQLVKYLGEIDLDYAVISNGLVSLQNLEKWCVEYGLKNWSVSVDTLDFSDREGISKDTIRKARAGMATLEFTKGLVRDRVSCTTITKWNVEEIPYIVARLSSIGVYTILSLVNQGKEGFQYSKGTPDMMPTQQQLETLVSKLKSMQQTGAYLFHDPSAVWDMWVEHGIKADWHCSRFTKFTIDADGTVSCCVDWKGKEYGKNKMLDITTENFAQIEEQFLVDIWDCKGCAWAPIKLLEHEQEKGEAAHDMLRHKMDNGELQKLLS